MLRNVKALLKKAQTLNPSEAISSVELWLKKIVIELNLCPFASAVFFKDQIRYHYSGELNPAQLKETCLDLCHELLMANQSFETTIMIVPGLADYFQYLEVIDELNQQLDTTGLAGLVQLASFHPDYQFAGEAVDSRSHYTNRSPLPLIHILKEESVSAAVASHPDSSQIPQQNIERLARLPAARFNDLFRKS